MQPSDFIITVDNRGIENGSNRVESGKKKTSTQEGRKGSSHNGNNIRLFN